MAPACRQQISTASEFRRRGETRPRRSALVRDSGRRARVLTRRGVASGHRDHLGKNQCIKFGATEPLRFMQSSRSSRRFWWRLTLSRRPSRSPAPKSSRRRFPFLFLSSALGQKRKGSRRAHVFRFTPGSRRSNGHSLRSRLGHERRNRILPDSRSMSGMGPRADLRSAQRESQPSSPSNLPPPAGRSWRVDSLRGQAPLPI